jgi:sialate O-acetylesterase
MLQRMRRRLAWAVASTICAAAVPAARAAEAPLMNAIFANHVVLQRDRPIDIWGRANAGESVTVTLSGATRTTQTDANGNWALAMPALAAGGPHTLTARTATRVQNADDVLVGDVWLCSGQSNMEWPVRNTLSADSEVALSANDGIRQVTIARATSAAPLAAFEAPLEWKVAGPATTQDFSATCYYFVRELQKTVAAPQGIISSNWGGSRIETWMSAQALSAVGGHQTQIELLGEYRVNKQVAFWHWGEIWQKWWNGQTAVTGGKQPWLATRGDAAEWQRAPAALNYWETWNVPALGRYDGMVWFRARVKLDKAQARQAARVSVGQVDDVDMTWVNGRVVGNSSDGDVRVYSLPPQLLKAGDNLVVINVHDFWGDGGLYGSPEGRALLLADGTRVPLENWEYQIAPAGLSWPPHAPWESLSGVNVLYNAMIAPLGEFGLRGVVWYQGEANAGLEDAQKYQELLHAWMADWRRQFHAPLPFLIVQLANYGELAKTNVDSGWAQLRDAQRRAVAADGNAGLAITYDIGNRDDIHPTNKQDVGKRLARAARHVVYGEKLVPSGAAPKSAQRNASGVVVTLGDYDGNLMVIGSKDPSGFELCGREQQTCHFVRAQLLENSRVALEDANAAAATRVRFCWADSPLCNLYDGAVLPVGPFEIPID